MCALLAFLNFCSNRASNHGHEAKPGIGGVSTTHRRLDVAESHEVDRTHIWRTFVANQLEALDNLVTFVIVQAA